MGFFDKLKKINIFANFGTELTDDFYDELEESLILADTGMDVTLDLVEQLRRLPQSGDHFEWNGLDVTVTQVDHRRVLEIRVADPEKTPAEA